MTEAQAKFVRLRGMIARGISTPPASVLWSVSKRETFPISGFRRSFATPV